MGQGSRRKKFDRRALLGGLAAVLFVFGIVTFVLGSARPWGIQQILGLAAAVVGIVLMFVRLWLPRSTG